MVLISDVCYTYIKIKDVHQGFRLIEVHHQGCGLNAIKQGEEERKEMSGRTETPASEKAFVSLKGGLWALGAQSVLLGRV